jgi:hypothetical protein
VHKKISVVYFVPIFFTTADLVAFSRFARAARGYYVAMESLTNENGGYKAAELDGFELHVHTSISFLKTPVAMEPQEIAVSIIGISRSSFCP